MKTLDQLLDDVEEQISGMAAEIATLRGEIAADNQRLRDAEERVWPGQTHGCDAPEWMADEILALRAEVERLREQLATWSESGELMTAKIADLREKLAAAETARNMWRAISGDNIVATMEKQIVALQAEIVAMQQKIATAGDDGELERLRKFRYLSDVVVRSDYSDADARRLMKSAIDHFDADSAGAAESARRHYEHAMRQECEENNDDNSREVARG